MGICGSNPNAGAGIKLSTPSVAKRRPKGEFVVFLGRASNLPNMDSSLRANDVTDCYARIQLKDENGVPISPEFRSQIREDTLDPIWNTYAAFACKPLDEDMVCVSIFDHDDLSKDDYIGYLEVPVLEIRKFSIAKPCNFVLKLETTIKPLKEDQLSTISLGTMQANECCVPGREKDAGFGVEKEFWLIRHGESKWNEAEHNHAIGDMLAYDHPLNKTGIEQALQFNSKWRSIQQDKTYNMTEAEKGFLNAERVIASPLTRAIQTALLTCHSHKNLGKGDGDRPGRPLLLLRNLREKKNKSISLDTVGQCIGDQIAKRVLEQMVEENWKENPEKGKKYMEDIEVNDCNSKWWTGKSHGDSRGMMTSRYDELWNYCKYMKKRLLF